MVVREGGRGVGEGREDDEREGEREEEENRKSQKMAGMGVDDAFGLGENSAEVKGMC